MFNEVQEDIPAFKTGIAMKRTSGNVEIPRRSYSYSVTCGWIKECERHLLFCAHL